MNTSFLTDIERMEKADDKRLDNIITVTLNALADRIENKKKVLDDITDGGKTANRHTHALMDAITTYLDESFVDAIAVPNYVQKQKSCQDIFVFVGSHWKQVVHQQFIDFIRGCCHRLGLDETYVGDCAFMNRLIEQLTFRRSQYNPRPVPKGEVWINLMNGTLEIYNDRNVMFRKHRPEDFFTYCLPYAYDKKAECPKWLAFLHRVMPEQEMQLLLAEYVGYCFTKNLKLEKMAVFYGTGCNGKSVTMDVIENVMGKENVSHVSLSAVTTDDEKRVLLDDKLVNISPESSKDIDSAMLKQIISGEPVSVRKLYVGSYVIRDYAKLITSFNVLPPSERTYGYYRRWLLFPFRVTIPKDEQDVNLVSKLCEELPGIMNWVLEGLGRLIANKSFTSSELCTQALYEYQKRSNSALMFLTERCKIDDSVKNKLKDLYSSYSLFCNEEGIMNKMNKRNFKEQLESYGGQSRLMHGNVYYNVFVEKYE